MDITFDTRRGRTPAPSPAARAAGGPEEGPRRHGRLARQLATLLLAFAAGCPAQAYESDVHDGLTRWLALKAGFSDWQANAIASGNARVDSGTMGTLALLPQHACIKEDAAAAREIQQRHYPSAAKVPADPRHRHVEPGSPAAREALATALQRAKGHEAQYLAQFGAALHPLQDSWAHAGVPAHPAFGPLECDAALASTPPPRGSDGPHAADLTFVSPAAAVAMAKATYDALLAFPSVRGEKRSPQDWASLEARVRAFAQARSKTAKRAWFAAQGIADTGFLAGTTLPDGPEPGSLDADGRQLPALAKAASMQHDAPADAREFFDRLLQRWLGDEPVEAVVADLAKGTPGRQQGGAAAASHATQLATRLKLWKLRDHGSSARLAHLARRFTAAEIAQVDALGRKPAANVAVPVEQAFFPLVIREPHPSPLLPYILHILPAQGGAASRAIAIARLRHAPRDTIGLLAEKSAAGWALVDLVSVVDQ